MRFSRTSVILLVALLLSVGGELVSQHSAVAAGTKQASFKVTWNDAFGIDMNWLRNSVKVTYNDSNYVTSVSCRDATYANSYTVWILVAKDGACDSSSGYGDSNTYAKFYTPVPASPQWTFYSRNHAYATPYGMSAWIDNTWAAGTVSSTFFWDSVYYPNQYL